MVQWNNQFYWCYSLWLTPPPNDVMYVCKHVCHTCMSCIYVIHVHRECMSYMYVMRIIACMCVCPVMHVCHACKSNMYMMHVNQACMYGCMYGCMDAHMLCTYATHWCHVCLQTCMPCMYIIHVCHPCTSWMGDWWE